MGESNLLDLAVIRQLVDEMGDDTRDIFSELVDSLEHDTARSLDEMRAAIEHASGKDLKPAAHRLKGSSATLGAKRMASVCRELESLGTHDDITAAAPMLDRLERIATESFKALRELSL